MTVCPACEADVEIDENPFLHRVFLTLRRENGVWILRNVGSRLSAACHNRESCTCTTALTAGSTA